MNNFTFCTPTRYEFGRGVENRVGALAAALPAHHVLVVYGSGSAVRSGLLDRVRVSLEAAQVPYTMMGGVQPNPTDDRVYEGIETVRRLQIDAIIAVGGGSVIDTAKAIAAGALYDGDFWDFFTGKPIERALPVGVVLTIPAAGSEGSGNCVITRREGLHKISIRTDFVLRPKFALLNPELTFTLPPYQTAAGIVDMMAHIFERYFSPTEGVEVTDRISEGLLTAIMTEATRVISQPDDYDARANIMWSGTLAHNGICGCGRAEDWVSHRMEHELSAVYGVTRRRPRCRQPRMDDIHGRAPSCQGRTDGPSTFRRYQSRRSPSRPRRHHRSAQLLSLDRYADNLVRVGHRKPRHRPVS